MNYMLVKVPGEFTDEDRWFRFFYKKNLIVLAIGLMFTWILWQVLSWVGLEIVGIVIGVVFTVIITGITMIPVPDLGNMRGAGQTLDQLIIKKWIRKKNRVIYVKGYGKDKYYANN